MTPIDLFVVSDDDRVELLLAESVRDRLQREGGAAGGLASLSDEALLLRTDQAVRHALDVLREGNMRTTNVGLVLLAVVGHRAVVGQLGDAGLFRLRRGGVARIGIGAMSGEELCASLRLDPGQSEPDLAVLHVEPDDVFLLCTPSAGRVIDIEVEAAGLIEPEHLVGLENALISLARERGAEEATIVVAGPGITTT